MPVNGFLVNNTVQKYNYESLENYNTPDFSTSSTYQVGDYVMYQGKLYKCTTAITTSGAWDSTKWSLAILSDDVADLKSALESGQYGLGESAKQALLQIARKVAYIDDQGQIYYNILYNAFYPPADLSSIAAVYTQSGTVYDTDSLDSLKADLVVTATYSDSSTQTVLAADYTLSGTLTHEQIIVDLLDGATWTDGIAIDASGNQISVDTLSLSSFIAVTPGIKYIYSKTSTGQQQYSMNINYYDANQSFLGRDTTEATLVGSEYKKACIPASNVAYVTIMSRIDAKPSATFEYDATPASWTSEIGVSYGGKSTSFNVTVTRAVELFAGVSFAKSTQGGTITENQDGTVTMTTTGNATWNLDYQPSSPLIYLPQWGNLKGHTVRIAYDFSWAAKTADSSSLVSVMLTSRPDSFAESYRLRYNEPLSNNDNASGYIDFLVPTTADGWRAGSGTPTDESYFCYRVYLSSSTAGANVTVGLRFYDLGIVE